MRLGSVTILALGWLTTLYANPSAVPTAPSRYHLRYSVEIDSPEKAQTPAKGILDVAEEGGKMLVRLDAPGDAAFSFLYDGNETFGTTVPTQALVETGFKLNLLKLPLYFPFNYAAKEVLHDVQAAYDSAGAEGAKRLKEYFPQANISAFFGLINGNKELYDAGRIDTKGSGAERTIELTLGAPGYVRQHFVYAKFQPLGAIEVPGTIDMKRFQQAANGKGGVRMDLVGTYRFKLLSCTEDPPSDAQPVLDSVLKDGMFVSYNGALGSAGVLFEKSKGPFDRQLASQLGLRKRYSDQQEGRGPGTAKSPSTIPLVLSGVFGVTAIVLLLRGRRRS